MPSTEGGGHSTLPEGPSQCFPGPRPAPPGPEIPDNAQKALNGLKKLLPFKSCRWAIQGAIGLRNPDVADGPIVRVGGDWGVVR